MTTWRADEPLEDVFWFSQFCGLHPSLELQKTYIVHISPASKEAVMLRTFAAAQVPTDG